MGGALTNRKQAYFDHIGYVPHPGQVKIHDSTKRNQVIACGRRFGKTTCVAKEGEYASLFTPRGEVVGWVVAPTYHLTEMIFRQIRRDLTRHFPELIIRESVRERVIVHYNFYGGISEIRARSAKNPEELIGEGLDWLIIDECSRVSRRAFDNLKPALLDKDGWLKLISTPKGKNWFYKEMLRARKRENFGIYEAFNLPSSTNPIMTPEKLAVERRLVSDRVFRQEYLAEFLEGEGAVFRNVHEVQTEKPRERGVTGVQYYGGLDLAKNEDYTVYTIVDKQARMVFQDAWTRLDWPVQVERAKQISERFGRPITYVDATGVGDPVEGMLKRAGLRTKAFKFAQKSRTDLLNNIQTMIEQQRCRLFAEGYTDDLQYQLEAFEFHTSPSGSTKMAVPDGEHDDHVMSLGLALWPLRKLVGGGGDSVSYRKAG